MEQATHVVRRASPEPHAVLGVRRGANRDEIGRAFRARARQVHPDVSGADTTEAIAGLTAARDAMLEYASSGAPFDPDARRHEPPDWAVAHAPAWTDHWAAWNEPRDRKS